MSEDTSVEKVAKGWKERAVIAHQYLSTDEDVEFYLFMVNGIADGVRIKDLLAEQGKKWVDFSYLMPGNCELKSIYNVAVSLGEVYRQRLREDEAQKRAVDGTKKKVYYKGKVVDTTQEKSDSLLALLLKAGDPDRFSDKKQVAMTGAVLTLNAVGIERAPIDVDSEDIVD